MMILKCDKCGSTNIAGGKYSFQFKCLDCGRELELHEVTFVRFPAGGAQPNPQTTSVELMGASTVAQNG